MDPEPGAGQRKPSQKQRDKDKVGEQGSEVGHFPSALDPFHEEDVDCDPWNQEANPELKMWEPDPIVDVGVLWENAGAIEKDSVLIQVIATVANYR